MGCRYWLVTVVLLSTGVAGSSFGFVGALGLTIAGTLNHLLRKRSIVSFAAQVRTGYLPLLPVSLPRPMEWLYWVPTIGSWAQVLFGYCEMARIVSLAPWSRQEQYTWPLFWRRLAARPTRGNILQGLPLAPPAR